MSDILPRPEELRRVANFKRLTELWQGDPEFRTEVLANPAGRTALLERHGIALHAEETAPFWPLTEAKDDGDRERAMATWEQSPVGATWMNWARATRERIRRIGANWDVTGNVRFDAWRRRQIARARSEAYVPSLHEFLPPLFSFELSRGCSKGCWFCAFSPEKLTQNFLYTPENRRLWREILTIAEETFGVACRTSVCYHSTEPTDNPDYLHFVRDHHEIAGSVPQTTTVDPLKNVEWTREMLRLRPLDLSTIDRFSVLTLRTLREIHAAFTAEELLYVNLVLHNKGSLTLKNECGRALSHEQRLQSDQTRLLETMNKTDGRLTSQLTLECTVGYYVNMVDRTIKLISPCNATRERPLGHIVHAEGRFEDAAGFRAFIERSIEQCAREHLRPGDRLAFREDLAFEKFDDGFGLIARFMRHDLRGKPYYTALGELISAGTHTTAEVLDRLIDEGMPAPSAVSWLDKLHQRGLLAEA